MSNPSQVIETEAMRLNAICPYFTMFPLDFPLGILKVHAKPGARVLDPFCGRGTTNFAARLLGLDTIGIDARHDVEGTRVHRGSHVVVLLIALDQGIDQIQRSCRGGHFGCMDVAIHPKSRLFRIRPGLEIGRGHEPHFAPLVALADRFQADQARVFLCISLENAG